jgi:hypothetical protein
MDILLFGGAGAIGSHILTEALARGHAVTAVVHRRQLAAAPGLRTERGNIEDAAGVARLAAGRDAVVSAYSPGLGAMTAEEAAGRIARAHDSLFEGLVLAGTRRLVLVGGVGSLEASPGVDVVDSAFYSAEHRPYTLQNREILRALRAGRWDLDWTYVSPPLVIEAGERRGGFAVGGDRLIRDGQGASWITRKDFAVAVLDALEAGRFVRDRFTVAYA